MFLRSNKPKKSLSCIPIEAVARTGGGTVKGGNRIAVGGGTMTIVLGGTISAKTNKCKCQSLDKDGEKRKMHQQLHRHKEVLITKY